MKLAVISPYPKQQVVAQRKIFWPTTPSMVGCSPLPLWLVYKAHSGFLKKHDMISIARKCFCRFTKFLKVRKVGSGDIQMKALGLDGNFPDN